MSDDAVKRLGDLVEKELEAAGPDARAADVRARIERRIGEDALLSREFDAAAMRRFGEVVERALEMPHYRELPAQASVPVSRPAIRGPITVGDVGDIIVQLEVQARDASARDAESLRRLTANPLLARMMEHPGFLMALESGAIRNQLEQVAAIQ